MSRDKKGRLGNVAIAASRTAALLEQRSTEVTRGVGNAHPIFVDHGSGAKLWDSDGREYLDFVGGIGVLNVGHANARVIEAVRAQLERFTHVCFQVAMYEPYVELARRLNRLAPGPSRKKTLLLSTGAEATENAVKIAREHTGRPAVIAFQHGYHGRTLLALSMTGKNEPYKQHFGPFCSEIYHAPFPYEHQGWTTQRSLAALQDVFESDVAPDRVAAIIIEPILGEGGFVPAPIDFLKALREIATRHGIVLICDEIQTGFGRTGAMFDIEHAGIEADLLCVAKSVAAGLPLAAVVGKADIMDAPGPGGLGGTYAGNPLACAAALAVLDIFEEQQLIERAKVIGAAIERAMRDLQRRYPERVGDVRGRGAMFAMEFVDRAGEEPASKRIIAQARERGLLLLSAGSKGCVIRVLVPLVIGDADLAEGLKRLAASCDAVLK
ncbi:MAG: 4-aminobutyrate--2-oxoglutarate transaminase [Candidatus Eremiobacteraeota bacterium]|nr:4-aminobutyrate--2-oxoglutarate transaminase [Candidatus Eremiobacteraeota bacterium]